MATSPVLAQDSIATSPWNFSAGADIYYAYETNQPDERDRLYTTQAARHNEFNLNWGYLQADYRSKKVRGTMALHTGTYAQFNYAAEPNDLYRLIAEAHAGVNLGGSFWLDAGIIPSHVGYESTFSIFNEIYTRALMAEGSPYFSTGVQLSGDLCETLSFKAVLVNGWQNIAETNEAKSVGLALNFRPNDRLELNYGNYFGNESLLEDETLYRFFQHTYARYNFSEVFHAVVSFDLGSQQLLGASGEKTTETWYTGMVLGEYRPREHYSLAFRAELFNDPQQIIFATPNQQAFEIAGFSLGFNYFPAENAALRFESRYYSATEDIFPEEGGTFTGNNLLLVASMALHIR